MSLVDRFNRVHDYVRISVTDKCNLRCVYCMPEEGAVFEPEERHLTFEEIAQVVRVLAGLGVRKLRLTGGEPLLRKGLERLVSMLSDIPGIEDIALTTNGLLLAAQAEKLKAAGLTRVNISLDSLQPERYSLITRGGKIGKVMEGVDAALKAGLGPVKLNVVLMRGINEDEIEDFLRLTLNRRLNIRFIEYMPIGHQDDGWKTRYVPLSSVLEHAAAMGWQAERTAETIGNGPADNYRIPGASGSFGLIHPVSQHFCEACNRLRLTADGNIKPCLYWSDEYNVRPYIGNDEALRSLILRSLDAKPQNHEMALALAGAPSSRTPTTRRMWQIGG